jgi:hypothetical protein
MVNDSIEKVFKESLISIIKTFMFDNTIGESSQVILGNYTDFTRESIDRQG